MRLANPEELGEVVKLLKSHFPYIKFSIRELRDRAGVYVHGDTEVAAYLILDTKPDDEVIERHRDSFYILYMGVKKKYRGEGYSINLIKGIQTVAGDLGKPLYTYVAAFNKKALNLFVSQGFRVQREVIKYGQSWLEMLWLP
jgi:GNAT superfamily N-acetyltransferase